MVVNEKQCTEIYKCFMRDYTSGLCVLLVNMYSLFFPIDSFVVGFVHGLLSHPLFLIGGHLPHWCWFFLVVFGRWLVVVAYGSLRWYFGHVFYQCICCWFCALVSLSPTVSYQGSPTTPAFVYFGCF